MPGQAVKPPAQSGDKAQSHGQGNQSAPAPSPSLINKSEQPIAAENHTGQVAADEKEHSIKLTSLPPITLSDKRKTFWDHVLDWGPWVSNFLFLVVGGFQIWLLIRTWRTIDRQANLQEFTTRQWVDIEGWSIVGDDPRRFPKWGIYGDEPIREDEEFKETMEIQVYFEVVNNTPLPMSVKRVVTTVVRGSEENVCEESAIPDAATLPPKGNTGDNIYACFVPVMLTEREVELYATSGLGFWVSVVVYFLNAERIETPQVFSREVACNVRGFTFGKYPSKPKTRKHHE